MHSGLGRFSAVIDQRKQSDSFVLQDGFEVVQRGVYGMVAELMDDSSVV